MRKRVVEQNQQILHVKAGEKITFPVHSKHRFAKFQKLTPVRSTKDIHGFLVHWARIAKTKDQPAPQPKKTVAQFAKANVGVLQLNPLSIRVAKGAVLTLNNHLNHLQANTIELEGDLVSHGHLIIDCGTLTIK